MDSYDIIVIGGGHAGVEASHITAKMGLKTLLITHLIDNIALASCNPAVGGLGKGHLVKEIDALGGLMGLITDISGLQYRILNASKGPAVRGTRVQIDMDIYKKTARDILLHTQNLAIMQGEVAKILSKSKVANGVELSIGKRFYGKKIIITSGTFLKGLIHIGRHKSQSGRAGESASNALSDSLKSLGIKLERLKTGTCPRILGNSIDTSELERHWGDAYSHLGGVKDPKINAPYFSVYTHEILNNYAFRESQRNDLRFKLLESRIKNDTFAPYELPCYVTYTNEKTHNIIESNFFQAPLFTGQIQGVGPRYCPSIEDKVNRFRDKGRHQLFLEPQTYMAGEYYVNGLSTSLPFEVQEAVIHSIKGLESALITRYGYAIEYDYSQPTGLLHTLESKVVKNLYLAGQINGTTGYEEAAAQGLMAGINAGLSVIQRDFKDSKILYRKTNWAGAGCGVQKIESKNLSIPTPPPLRLESKDSKNLKDSGVLTGDFIESSLLDSLILTRSDGYIGVMIDDLVTKGTNEPYRVFTSRAEYRLLLREDNACFRLLEYTRSLGLLDPQILQSLDRDKKDIESCLHIASESYTPSRENLRRLDAIGEAGFTNKCEFALIISRESMSVSRLRRLDSRFLNLSERTLRQIQIYAKYKDYIAKQEEQIKRSEKTLSLKIPHNFTYHGISGLSLEAMEKLDLHKPRTLREASLISGITPANLEVLELHIIISQKCL